MYIHYNPTLSTFFSPHDHYILVLPPNEYKSHKKYSRKVHMLPINRARDDIGYFFDFQVLKRNGMREGRSIKEIKYVVLQDQLQFDRTVAELRIKASNARSKKAGKFNESLPSSRIKR